MSYYVKLDDKTLYEPLLQSEGYVIISPSVTKAKNKAGSFTFKIPPTNPLYGSLKKLKSIISVYKDGNIFWKGRVLDERKDFNKIKEVTCEGELAFLNDVIIAPYDYSEKGMTINEFFQYVMDLYAKNCSGYRKIQPGYVYNVDSDTRIYPVSKTYENVLSTLSSKLIGVVGGVLVFRYQNGVSYLDYYGHISDVIRQKIEFGKNLINLEEYVDATDVYTYLIPLGKQDDSGNYLDISSVNSGLNYIYSKTGLELYGKITKTVEYTDIEDAALLKQKAEAVLADAIKEATTITIKAVDLRVLGVDTDAIDVNCLVNVVSPPHGINSNFECTEITFDLSNVANNEYTFGSDTKSLSELEVESSSTTRLDTNIQNTSSYWDIRKQVKYAIQSADGKTTNYYSPKPPYTKDGKIGDTWFDTDDDNRMYTWDGEKWVSMQFGFDAIKDKAIQTTKIGDKAVTWEQIDNLAVTAEKLADAAVTADKIKDKVIAAEKLVDGCITADKIKDKVIAAEKLVDGCITADKIKDKVIAAEKLVDGCITADKIKDKVISAEKIVDGCITADQIADKVISAEKIIDGCITADQIADKVISAEKIVDKAITNILLAPDSITADKIKNKVISAEKIVDKAITNILLAPDSITADKIKDKVISAEKIVDGCITADQIADKVISAEKIVDGCITADQIADKVISAEKIVDGCITADQIADKVISAEKIVDGCITADQIADKTINGEKIESASITNVCIANGAIDNAKIANGAIDNAKIGIAAIDTAKIKDGAITNAKIGSAAIDNVKIANGAITNAKIANGAIDNAKIANGAITNAKIGTAAITNAKIANGAIDNAKIKDGAIDNAKIGTAAIDTVNIKEGAIDNACIANAAIDSAKIVNGAITNAKIANGAIDNAKIGIAAIDTANIKEGAIDNACIGIATIDATKIKDGAITNAKIENGAITNAKIGTAAIDTTKIKDGAIDNAKIANGAIDNAKIGTAAITTAKIKDGAIDNAKIANGAITNAKIGTAAIDTTKIENGAITNAKIENGAITNAKIGTAAIDTVNIKDGAIDNAKIANGAITNAKIGTAAIDTTKIENGAITNAKIENGAITNAKIGTAAIDTVNIKDGAINTACIAKAAITGALIENGSIGNAHITNGAISSAKIQNGAITNALIENAAITTAKIKDGAITNAKISNLDAGKITSGTINAAYVAIGDMTNFATVTVTDANSMIKNYGGTKISTVSNYSAIVSAGLNNTSRYIMLCGLTASSFLSGDKVHAYAKVYTNVKQTVGMGMWFYDIKGGFVTWRGLNYTSSVGWNDVVTLITLNDLPSNVAYFVVGFDFYGSGTRAVRDVVFKQVATNLIVGDACYINSDGSFMLGPLQSKGSDPANYDLVIRKAAWIRYGLELLGANEAGTAYIDFHYGEKDYNGKNPVSDYTARLCEESKGIITARNSIVSSSDARLKENITDIPDVYIELVKRLQPKMFNFIGSSYKTTGLIAQDVLEIEKELGITESVLIRGTGEGDNYYSLDYNALSVLMLAYLLQKGDTNESAK